MRPLMYDLVIDQEKALDEYNIVEKKVTAMRRDAKIIE